MPGWIVDSVRNDLGGLHRFVNDHAGEGDVNQRIQAAHHGAGEQHACEMSPVQRRGQHRHARGISLRLNSSTRSSMSDR